MKILDIIYIITLGVRTCIAHSEAVPAVADPLGVDELVRGLLGWIKR